jgi:glycosyltransferase involved in cell wall biosynthesis
MDLAIAGGIGEHINRKGLISKRIKILGIVPDKILKSLYCCAAISLAPIVSGGGVPIKLIESILHGVPTITSRRAELIVPGLKHLDNVVIIEKIGSLSEALKTLTRNRDLRYRISEGALQLAEKAIGFEKTINRYIEHIEKIL